MKNNVVETLIGAAVIAIAIVFFSYVYTTADVGAGSDGYEVTARFTSVDGITTGSDVRMSGIKVGTVLDQWLDLQSYEAVLSIAFHSDIEIPADSSAKITADGLLGDKYVSVEPGGDETMIADGGSIEYTQGSLDIFGLISSFLFQDNDS